jgi:hypothetical protein
VTDARPTRRRGTLLVLVAVLVAAALLAGWLLGQRAGSGATATEASTPPASPTPSPTGTAIDAPVTGALTFEALMTPADIADAGVTVEDPLAIDAPAFPVLCEAAGWGTQWSAPEQGVGHEYPGQGALVSEYAVGYADDAAASAALARLTDDAASCPDLSTGGSIEVVPGDTVGDESALFLVDDGGRDGVIGVTWTVVVRSGSTLLQVGYTTEQQIGTGSGPVDGGGDDAAGDSPVARSTAEALARAAADRYAAGV